MEDDVTQIIISSEIVGEDSVNSYLAGRGYSPSGQYEEANPIENNETGQNYTYGTIPYSSDGGAAEAFFLDKEGVQYSVIVINDNWGDSEGFDVVAFVNALTIIIGIMEN